MEGTEGHSILGKLEKVALNAVYFDALYLTIMIIDLIIDLIIEKRYFCWLHIIKILTQLAESWYYSLLYTTSLIIYDIHLRIAVYCRTNKLILITKRIVNRAIYMRRYTMPKQFNRVASNIYQLVLRFLDKSCVRIDSFPNDTVNPSTWRSRISTMSRQAVSPYSGCSRSHIYFRFLASISLRSRDIGGGTGRERGEEGLSRECNMDPILRRV